MSAEDFLSDDEEITMSLQSIGLDVGFGSKSIIFPLYEAALRLVENGTVPYRSLRQTELTGGSTPLENNIWKLFIASFPLKVVSTETTST